MQIPAHLRHLDTDAHGRPVPYVNIWGPDDDPNRWRLRYDRNLHTRGVWLDDDRAAGPDFTKQSPQRQREVMYLGKCQVCARAVTWPERSLVVSSISVHTIHVAGRDQVAFFEPWLCPDCAGFVTRVCPALIRRKHDDDFTLISDLTPSTCHLAVSTGWIEGPYEAASKADPPVMWVRALVPSAGIEIRTSAKR